MTDRWLPICGAVLAWTVCLGSTTVAPRDPTLTQVRIEAQDRISELRIRERSFDVDLATTRDKHNLQLFGLEQSPRSKADVTLDLQNYINEKITSDGQYEFHLFVTDKSDNTAEGKISVRSE